MPKYEYKVVFKGMPAAFNEKKYIEMAREFEQELNQLSAEGWEFVQWKNSMLIFRKEME